ncbi:MAG: RNA methyltransferase [Halodesulfurarchaeum sp.]|nr:RNA methyltransferase [Halodesulfurarchaeum sp.]
MTRSVLVPSSIVRETTDKRAATLKLGYVARAAAVFGIDRLGVFSDPEGITHLDGGFVETVLRYAATPPSLRKEVFGTRDELEYAGVLPPLRLSSWTGSESSGSGSIRQGVVTQVGSDGRVWVNCGLQHPVSLHVPSSMTVVEGERVTIRVSSREPVRAKLVDEPVPGFVVEGVDLRDALTRSDAGFRVATSRHGTPLTVSMAGELAARGVADGLTVAFGAPGRGLPEILGLDPSELAADSGPPSASETRPTTDQPGGFDAWLNTIPDQGSEVVRTEEAMFVSLAHLTLTE